MIIDSGQTNKYIGMLSQGEGIPHFEVYRIEKCGESIHSSVGRPISTYRFRDCVVLDDIILSNFHMTIDWSGVFS